MNPWWPNLMMVWGYYISGGKAEHSGVFCLHDPSLNPQRHRLSLAHSIKLEFLMNWPNDNWSFRENYITNKRISDAWYACCVSITDGLCSNARQACRHRAFGRNTMWMKRLPPSLRFSQQSWLSKLRQREWGTRRWNLVPVLGAFGICTKYEAWSR